ncbi:energy transducer TonB [candidate division KSB1 bacterium]|nr:energy transducer TonB [candidate division KSB1 bacterium]
MKTIITLLLTFSLLSCAARPKPRHQNEKTAEFIETISKNIDSPPEPVGGIEAIQAALREPDEVSKGNKEGEVIVEATINSNGRVIATKIAQSSGYAGMDSEAMLAVARVSWKPARRKGAPVTATVRVPVMFATN